MIIIKEHIQWQEQIQSEIGQPKEPIVNDIDWDDWTEKINTFFTHERLLSTFVDDKVQRSAALRILLEDFKEESKDSY